MSQVLNPGQQKEDKSSDRWKSRAFGLILDSASHIFGVLMLLACLIICADVVLRYFFHSPIKWSEELASYVLLWSTFGAGAWILRRDGHVRIDFLIAKLAPRTRLTIDIVTYIAGALLWLSIALAGGYVTWDLLARDVHIVSYLMPSQGLLFFIIPLGSLMLSVECTIKAYQSAKLKRLNIDTV